MANFSTSGLIFFIFVIVFTAICGGFLGLRFWAARVAGRGFFLDDFFVVFAYTNCIALGGVGLWAALNGLGKPGAELSPSELVVNAKLVMASNVCWLLASVFVKMSLLWLFNRLFTTKAFRRWCWAAILVNASYGVSFLVVYLTNCQPIDQLWNPRPDGHCRNMEISDFATIGINLLLDLAILLLPLPTLWGLQLPVRKKIVITIMLSFGLVTIAIMIWRITATIGTRGDPDFTKHLGLIGLISFFELWLGLIVACIPTLGPLYKMYSKSAPTKGSGSYATGSYGRSHITTERSNGHRADGFHELDDLQPLQTQSDEELFATLTTARERNPGANNVLNLAPSVHSQSANIKG